MTTLTIDKQIDYGPLSGVFEPSAYVRSWDKELISQYLPHSASISSGINDILAFLASRGVDIEDNVVVENFLANNYGTVAYLFEVPDKVSQYFGESSLKMGIFSDPDSGDEQPELYFEVETNFSPEEADERLSKLNREWLFVSNDQNLISLNITLRFT